MREETAPRSCRAGMRGGGVSSQQFVCRGGGGGANKPGDHGSWALQFRFLGRSPGMHRMHLRSWVSPGMEYRAEAWGGGSTPGSLRSLGPPPHPLPLGINKVGSRAHLRSRVSIGDQQGGISCPLEVSDPLPLHACVHKRAGISSGGSATSCLHPAWMLPH